MRYAPDREFKVKVHGDVFGEQSVDNREEVLVGVRNPEGKKYQLTVILLNVQF